MSVQKTWIPNATFNDAMAVCAKQLPEQYQIYVCAGYGDPYVCWGKYGHVTNTLDDSSRTLLERLNDALGMVIEDSERDA